MAHADLSQGDEVFSVSYTTHAFSAAKRHPRRPRLKRVVKALAHLGRPRSLRRVVPGDAGSRVRKSDASFHALTLIRVGLIVAAALWREGLAVDALSVSKLGLTESEAIPLCACLTPLKVTHHVGVTALKSGLSRAGFNKRLGLGRCAAPGV